MDPTFLVLVLLFVSPLVAVSQPSSVTSHITVTGSVFCDVCYNNSFTKHSYFLPGADVHVECRFQANAPKTTERITFSVNRTTNRYGVYRLDIPSVEGVDCEEGPAIQSFCEASLIGSSFTGCNVPSISTTSKEITVKSRSTNLCVYGVSALSYKPFKRNSTLCGNYDIKLDEEKLSSSDSFNSSKFFLPYFPWPFPPFPPFPSLPPWPSLPPLPPLPQLPPFPSFPPFPPFQFPPFQFPPSSPLPSLPPLPQLPPLPPLPQLPPLPPFTLAPPQPPSFQYPPTNFPPFTNPPVLNPPPSFQNPPTNFPPFTSPPVLNPSPLAPLNPSDPRTWIPENPFPIPRPSPPGFNLRDPRSWIPNFPPSPNSPQSEQP